MNKPRQAHQKVVMEDSEETFLSKNGLERLSKLHTQFENQTVGSTPISGSLFVAQSSIIYALNSSKGCCLILGSLIQVHKSICVVFHIVFYVLNFFWKVNNSGC